MSVSKWMHKSLNYSSNRLKQYKLRTLKKTIFACQGTKDWIIQGLSIVISMSRIQTASCLSLLRPISKRLRAKYIRRSIAENSDLTIRSGPFSFRRSFHFARLLNLSRLYFALALRACRNDRLLAVCPQLYDNCMINNRKCPSTPYT